MKENLPPAPELSVVLPFYNEASLVGHVVSAVQEACRGHARSLEIVAVDDGSSDGTGEGLDALAEHYPLKVVRFSRNFGKEAALAAGLEYARGEAIVFMDGDLQHPPSVVGEMLARWREGFDVVNGRKGGRGRENLLYRCMAKLFNRLFGRVTGSDFEGQSDFKLIDRSVANALLQLPESGRFFRGMVQWAGFRQCEVEFEVKERVGGQSKWSLVQLIKYSLANLVSFSSQPLYWISFIGLIFILAAGGLAIQTLYVYLSGRAVSGFTTVIILILGFAGLGFFQMGIMAIYLAEVYREVKRRPVFVIKPRDGRKPKDEQAVEQALK